MTGASPSSVPRQKGQMAKPCTGEPSASLTLAPYPSRRLLAPWMPSALPPAALSPPSWDPMPSRFHCLSARRYATAWMPPTLGAMTGGYWRRSSPWISECCAQTTACPHLPLSLGSRRGRQLSSLRQEPTICCRSGAQAWVC